MAFSSNLWLALALTMAGTVLRQAETYKSNNEVCTNTPRGPDDPQRCDPEAFLICGNKLLCTCASSLIWNEGLGKCTYSVDETCADNNGTPVFPGGSSQGGNGPTPACPKNSFCDNRGSRKCQCNSGYAPNEDNSECNGGSQAQLSYLTLLSLVVSAVFALKTLC